MIRRRLEAIFGILKSRESTDNLCQWNIIYLIKNSTVRYFFVGALGAIIEVALFIGLIKAGWGVIHSNIVAFHCAFVVCYFLHYYYTHQKPYEGTKNVLSGFFKYTGLMYAQFFIGTMLLWLLTVKFSWQPDISKIVQIVIVTPIGYIVQKLIIFRKVRPN